jgi:hypothetical protein
MTFTRLPSSLGWLFASLFLAFLFRLPSFPFSVIDWDESTFAIMGDSVMRGHLPYTELTDNKPPLIFLFFAAIQALFGKSLLAIRLAATVLTALTAWLCVLTARRAFGLGPWSMLALVPVVALASVKPGTGALLTEHLAILPMAGALYLLTADHWRPGRAFALGLFAALAVLTRTNLVYPAILLAFAALRLKPVPGAHRLTIIAAFGAGAVLPLVLLLAAYRDALDVLYRATVAGPLAYSGGASLFTPAWFRSIGALLALCFQPSMALLSAGFAAGAALAFARPDRRGMAVALLVGWLGTVAGIAAGGWMFEHYLIQLLPFMAPLFAVAMEPMARARRRTIALVATVLCLWWGALLAQPYRYHAQRWRAGVWDQPDPPAQLVAHLDQAGARGKTLFIADAHIAYWLLDAVPPTRVVHPSNLGLPAMMRAVLGPEWGAVSELDAIFARAPAFVVLPDDLDLLTLDPEARRRLEHHLAQAYQIDTMIAQLRVYVHRETPAARPARP